MIRTTFAAALLTLLLAPAAVSAAPPTPISFWPAPTHDVWQVCFTDACDAAPAVPTSAVTIEVPFTLPPLADAGPPDLDQGRRPIAIEYSHGYEVRLKIHKYASYATLPLFGAEWWLGQSLYSNTPADRGDPRKGLHALVGASIVGLFGLNTVTGAWNMFGEGWKDPNHHTLRLVHGLLMMAADAGFVYVAMNGPNSRRVSEALTYESDKAFHRNVAIASISTATVSYLIMLFGNK